MEEKKYFIMTSEQKKFLEDVFKCLDIDFEDVLEIANLRKLSERVKTIEAQNQKFTELLVQLNNRLAEVEREIIQRNMEEVQGVLAQDE